MDFCIGTNDQNLKCCKGSCGSYQTDPAACLVTAVNMQYSIKSKNVDLMFSFVRFPFGPSDSSLSLKFAGQLESILGFLSSFDPEPSYGSVEVGNYHISKVWYVKMMDDNCVPIIDGYFVLTSLSTGIQASQVPTLSMRLSKMMSL